MLDKEQRYVPDLKTWYAPHDTAFRADPADADGSVKARNHVVHQGDLELHSRARVRVLISGRELPEIDLDVPPLLDQDEIASLIAPRLSARVREHGVLAVERRWVAARKVLTTSSSRCSRTATARLQRWSMPIVRPASSCRPSVTRHMRGAEEIASTSAVG